MKRDLLPALLLPLLLLAAPAHAIFKCTDGEGGITFSQAPCPSDEHATEMDIGGTGPRVDERTCELARLFATDVFQRMQQNPDSQQELGRYGGVYGAGNAILGVVNYVYTFRHAGGTAPRRVGALAESKCRNGGFGAIAFDQLPVDEYYRYDEASQGWIRKQAAVPQPTAAPASSPQAGAEPPAATTDEGFDNGELQQQKCERLRADLEALDQQARSGYEHSEADSLRAERRALRRQISRDCR